MENSLIGYITNNSYLDGLIHRAMRRKILDDFDLIQITDLRGSTRRGNATKNEISDENVFDIQQGVATAFLLKKGEDKSIYSPCYCAIVSDRSTKYNKLLDSSSWISHFQSLLPVDPYFFFAPKTFDLDDEYLKYTRWDDLFLEYKLGFMSGNDQLLLDHDPSDLASRIKNVLDPEIDAKTISKKYSIKSNYPVAHMRRATFNKKKIIRCGYRPFDDRFAYYDNDVMERSLFSINQHFLAPNLGFCVSRQLSALPYRHAFVTNKVTEMSLISNKTKEANRLVPLYLYDKADQELFVKHNIPQRRSNIKPQFLRHASRMLNLSLLQDGSGDLRLTIGPEDVFLYIYAILFSPVFRNRYGAYLEIDFPRLPLAQNIELFRALATLGAELAALHLLAAKNLDKARSKFFGKNRVAFKPGWTDDNGGTVWIDSKGTGKNLKPGTSGFAPVPEEVWNFHIGGYQVCHKWLKDRKGRTLTDDDLAHYHKIVIALTETIRLMKEIDEVIDQHGGWPGAFQTDNAKSDSESSAKS